MRHLFYISAGFVFVVIFFGVIQSFAEENTAFPTDLDNTQNQQKEQIKENKEDQSEISIFMVGDIMLDRDIRKIATKQKNYEYAFELIDETIKNFDIRIANLEGPITDFKSVSEPNGLLKFTIPVDFLSPISKRFEAVSLANNHMLDFGQTGYSQTKKYLSKYRISYFGDAQNREEFISTIITKNNFKIGLVGYHAIWAEDTKNIINEIKKIKDSADYVIVYPHWGYEYKNMPSTQQKKQAKSFIDSGASLVIGSHPHVTQTIEIYKNKAIFYSLGNFIFDQYWSTETMRGLAIGLKITKTKNKTSQSFSLFPIDINTKAQPEIATQENTKKMLNRLSESATADEKIKQQILKGEFIIFEE